MAGALLILGGTGVAANDPPAMLSAPLVAHLEQRFSRADVADWTSVTGIVVACGNVNRVVEAMRLAAAYPHLRVVLSGPGPEELQTAQAAGEAIWSRVVVESVSLNTYGNAYFSKKLIDPKPAERWLMITSASHMPRAIGSFYRVGFAVDPWPVADGFVDGPTLGTVARHEWLGLIAYWVRGRTIAILPGQDDLARYKALMPQG